MFAFVLERVASTRPPKAGGISARRGGSECTTSAYFERTRFPSASSPPSFLPSFPRFAPVGVPAQPNAVSLSLSLSLSSVPSLAPVATPTRTTAITHATATVDHCCRRHRQTGQPAGRLSRAPFDAAPKLGSATETAASSCCVGVASRCAADADAVVVVRAERVDICRLPARCRFHEQPFHIKARYVLQERKSGEAENHLNLSC